MLKELWEKRNKAIADARAVFEAAEKEARSPSAEENAKFDAFMADADSHKAEYDRRAKLETEGAEQRDGHERRGRKTDPGRGGDGNEVTSEKRDLAFRAWAKVPVLGQSSDALGGKTIEISTEERAAAHACGINLDTKILPMRLFKRAHRTRAEIEKEFEQRAALGIGSAGIGLNTVPDEMMRPIETSLLAFGGVRETSTIIRTATGADLPIPTSNDTGNKGRRLAENTAVTQTEMTFGQIVLKSYKYSSDLVKVAVEFLQDTSIDAAGWLGERLGERIARILADELTTGTGTSQPNGIVTAASSGLTAASATAITADELIELEHSVDPAYRSQPGSGYMFNDSTLKFLRKLKDGEGRYLWQQGLAAGAPDSLNSYQYTINQSMASIATTAKPVLFGALRKYIVRDVLDMVLLRLDERFADAHQVGFLAFSRHEGNLLDAGTDPVKFITMA